LSALCNIKILQITQKVKKKTAHRSLLAVPPPASRHVKYAKNSKEIPFFVFLKKILKIIQPNAVLKSIIYVRLIFRWLGGELFRKVLSQSPLQKGGKEMKRTRILFISLVVICILSLLVFAGSALGNDNGVEAPGIEESPGEPKIPEDPEKGTGEPAQAEASLEERAGETDDGVQREVTEEMKPIFYGMMNREPKEYDPNNEDCIRTVYFYEHSYYANDLINGYTLCHFSDELYTEEIVEYEKEGYFFTRRNRGSPSPLMLYLYKDGDFTPIEDALDSSLVKAADVHGILSADRNYGVKVNCADPPSDGVQREFTEEMKAVVYNMVKGGREEYDPDDEYCVRFISFYKFSYYANDMLNGYTLCHMLSEPSEEYIVEYEKDGYFFTRESGGDPSPLMLYLYKDGDFTPIEDALDSGLVSAADVHRIVASDANYCVKVEPLY